jgi:hypothetical protein
MEMKKIVTTLALIAVVLTAAIFGVRQFGQSKKTITLSVAELNNENIENVQENKQEIAVDQKVEEVIADNNQVVSSAVDSKASDNQKESTIGREVEKKLEVKKDSAVSEYKVSTPGKIVQNLVSWGFAKSSGRTIKAIIIHTSYNNLGGDVFDFDKVIQEWKDAGVAPHYAIDRDGTINQLVADQNIAWHAGVSKLPDGTTDVNGASIGIEIINSKDAKFTDDQYSALNSLIATLKKKYEIKYIFGHDEIAPGRKTDPWNIDWKKVQK